MILLFVNLIKHLYSMHHKARLLILITVHQLMTPNKWTT